MEFNFNELSHEFPLLKKFFHNGVFDFSSHESISCLTHYILLYYYKLNISISSTNLCPRIPNRLAYLYFIDKYLAKFDDENVALIDIGTGYCAIYLVLLAKLSKWQLLGTDIDIESINKARITLKENSLNDRVGLVHCQEKDPVLPNIPNGWARKEIITICNPPFYSNLDEIPQRELFKTPKRNQLVALTNELVVEGGEYEFIKRMVMENLHNTKIRWFTSLIGKYETISKLIKLMKLHNVSNFFITKLMDDKQGRTQRWIIGWSFNPKRVIIPVANSIANYNITMIPVIESFKMIFKNLDQLNLKYHLYDEDHIVVNIHRDVWSRKFKRRGKSIDDVIGIKVSIYKTQLNWIYGFNYNLFQSFGNFIRTLTKNSNLKDDL